MQHNPKKSGRVPDHEAIYRLLAEEDWPQLLSFVWENQSLVESDEIIRHAIQTCETVFFSKVGEEQEKEKLLNTLETFYVLHEQRKYRLSDTNFEALIVELVNLWREKDLEQAYTRAKHCPDNEVCKVLISQYEETLPKRVTHSQSGAIRVTENRNVSTVDGRCTLFKARQEKDFFNAVRDAFPHFTVYPNAALSSVINFDLIRDSLSTAEKDYYFKATIDCVVFDYHAELYLPVFFFELDSPLHDAPEQKRKDEYKDHILAAAGQQLYRIRRSGRRQKRGDFARLIRDLIEHELSTRRR
jgi:hypothetical protein